MTKIVRRRPCIHGHHTEYTASMPRPRSLRYRARDHVPLQRVHSSYTEVVSEQDQYITLRPQYL